MTTMQATRWWEAAPLADGQDQDRWWEAAPLTETVAQLPRNSQQTPTISPDRVAQLEAAKANLLSDDTSDQRIAGMVEQQRNARYTGHGGAPPQAQMYPATPASAGQMFTGHMMQGLSGVIPRAGQYEPVMETGEESRGAKLAGMAGNVAGSLPEVGLAMATGPAAPVMFAAQGAGAKLEQGAGAGEALTSGAITGVTMGLGFGIAGRAAGKALEGSVVKGLTEAVVGNVTTGEAQLVGQNIADVAYGHKSIEQAVADVKANAGSVAVESSMFGLLFTGVHAAAMAMRRPDGQAASAIADAQKRAVARSIETQQKDTANAQDVSGDAQEKAQASEAPASVQQAEGGPQVEPSPPAAPPPERSVTTTARPEGLDAEDLAQMSPTQIRSVMEQQHASDREVVAQIIGEERAAKLNMEHWSEKVIAEVEDKATPEQYRQLFQSGVNPETARAFITAHSDAVAHSPEELSRYLGNALIKLGNAPQKFTDMNLDQQAAAVLVRAGGEHAKSQGWNLDEISGAAIKYAASRFPDPEDAAFMLDRFLKPKKAQPQQAKLPAPQKQLSDLSPPSPSIQSEGKPKEGEGKQATKPDRIVRGVVKGVTHDGYEIMAVDGKQMGAAFGAAVTKPDGTKVILVRDDLPAVAERYVVAHEQYHHNHPEGNKLLGELKATLFPGIKDPIGLIRTVVASLHPKRMALYAGKFEEAPPDLAKPQEAAGGAAIKVGAETEQTRRGLISLPVKASIAVLKRNFTAAGDLPKPVFAEKIRNDASINSTLLQARFTLRDFDKAAKKSFGRKKLSEDQQKSIDDVLRGDKTIDTLPKTMRPVVQRMRTEIDALSRKMIDVGAVEGDLAAVVDSNMGVYLTRSYRAFDDPRWAQKVPQDIRNKAKALLRSEYPGKSPEEIDGLIEMLLYEGKAAESPIAMLKGSKLGAKDLSILTKRKGISPEIRALWGEYRDPRQNYARSVAKMAHLIGNHQFLGEVRKAGLGTFFHESPIVKDDIAYKTRIAADESSVMHPLNGLYTSPEIKRAFEEALQPQQAPDWFRWYMKANGLTKYAKTVLSIQTHIRNVTSNMGFAIANGHLRVAGTTKALGGSLASIGAMDSPKWRDYYTHLIEIGVVNESPRANELHDVIRDASKKSVNELLDAGLANLPKRIGRYATTLYRVEDDVWKIYAFENEKARYAKALPGKSTAEIEAIAAENVRNTYPTYSMVPRGVRALRRFPLVGAFVSFPWEVGRTGYHTLRLAAKELADPKLRGIGVQRAVGIIAAAGLMPMIAKTSRLIMGISNDDDDDMRRFLPPWSQNSLLGYVGRGDDGKPRVVDLGYTDPYTYLRKPVMALLRGDDWEDALWDATQEAMTPFFGEEILAGKGFDIARNTTKDGGRIWNPQDSVLQKTTDATLHLLDAMEPGTFSGIRRVNRGLTGYVTPYGKSYDPVIEAIALFTGQRITEIDIATSLTFKSKRYARDLSEATQIMSKKVGAKGPVDEGDLRSSVRRLVKARKRVFEDASKDAQAAMRQGMTRAEVLAVLHDAGMSDDTASAIVDGDYLPYAPSSIMRDRIGGMLKVFSDEEGVMPASTSNGLPKRPQRPTLPKRPAQPSQ